jgi:hypothetical protein
MAANGGVVPWTTADVVCSFHAVRDDEAAQDAPEAEDNRASGDLKVAECLIASGGDTAHVVDALVVEDHLAGAADVAVVMSGDGVMEKPAAVRYETTVAGDQPVEEEGRQTVGPAVLFDLLCARRCSSSAVIVVKAEGVGRCALTHGGGRDGRLTLCTRAARRTAC